jgi:sterol desaturase/sphingolipid hydroxylase (fatty acid hydroxylase superfamily)
MREYEVPIRLGAFLAVFTLLAIWELHAKRRMLSVRKPLRWANNLGLTLLNSVLMRGLLPVTAMSVADFAAGRDIGLLNVFELPFAAAVVVSVVALDLGIYLQHRIFHAVPILWRLHRMHHADLDIDVTTGTRFHPIEVLLSMLIKFVLIMALGPPVVAVLIFETLLNATSMFSHANARMPTALDDIARRFVVTPDMHRVHHSIDPAETRRNFGFNLPWWDRLFGTYQAQPRLGHDAMTIGLEHFRSPQDSYLHRLLAQPFKSTPKPFDPAEVVKSRDQSGWRAGSP